MKSKKEKIQSLKDIHNRLGRVSKLKDLSGKNVNVAQGSLSTKITGLITDSRRVTPGSAFFAIPGQRTDGNNFLE